MTGRKDDAGKAPLWHLGYVSGALADVSRVLEAGAAKYGVENWRKVDRFKERYSAALLRHVFAYLRGEVNDAEDGLPHLAHAMCCALFLLEGPAVEVPQARAAPSVGSKVKAIGNRWTAPEEYLGQTGTVSFVAHPGTYVAFADNTSWSFHIDDLQPL